MKARRGKFGMGGRRVAALLAAGALTAGVAPAALAGIVVYENGAKQVEIGGRIQIQYVYEDRSDRVDTGDTSSQDDLFFRRLRPYIQGTVSENWFAKIQFDLGKAEGDDEVAVKDAYMRYTGFDNLELTIGNQKPDFSREFLTSSKRLQLVERPFTGDHNYGSPDRFLGFRVNGSAADGKFAYGLSFGAEDHDPNAWALDFDTPVNGQEDRNQGFLVAGRVDFHPLGAMHYDQGDFHTDGMKFTVSLAGYSWHNDDDVHDYTDESGNVNMKGMDAMKVDLDKATGFELSGGVRGHGFSADAEYNMISADTVDTSFTGGLYKDGTTDLDVMSVKAGYMVVKERLEVVGGWQSLDADGYEESWDRTELGLNYFWNRYKVKGQLTYRMEENVDGIPDNDQDLVFLQMQFVF